MRNTRSFPITLVRGTTAGDESIRIAISTETPYCRYIPSIGIAYEVLGHQKGELDLSYLMDGAPFLFEHDTERQVGVLENVSLDADGVLRADVRFSKSAFGQEIKQDILDRIKTRISVGYDVAQYIATGETINEVPVVRAVAWTAYEASTVSIPADLNAGVGRSLDPSEINAFVAGLSDTQKEELLAHLTAPTETPEQESTQDPEEEAVEAETPVEQLAETIADIVQDLETPVEPDTTDPLEVTESDETTTKSLLNSMTNSASKAAVTHQEQHHMSELENGSTGADKETVKKITDLAIRHKMTDNLPTWLAEGRTYESVAAEILETRSNDSKVNAAPAVHTTKRTNDFAGAVKSFLRNDNSEVAERGLDQARNAGISIVPGTLYLPTDMEMFSAEKARRAFARSTTYGTNASANGSNAVGKAFLTFEETLREGSLLARVGGQILTLNDIGSMPYFSTPATASMVYETGSVSTSAVSVGLRSWTPKRIAARYSFSNLMGVLNGTYDFESELYNDLVAEGIRKFDQQVWAGTGANNITGLLYDTNIVEFGNSGSFSLGSGSALVANVAGRNGNVDAGAFVVSHATYGTLFATPAFGNGSGTSILDRLQSQNPVYRTGYFTAGLSGSLQAMFGDYSKVTAATFGPVQIKRDELTALQTGETILNFEMFADSVARQPDALVKWTYIIPS